ncbi:hypothetical protein [Arthrobacter sp. HS15c]|uniref:hypothetical protein n=1 Tax=Arthrobacter sp. HS15c TaxID=3230279 RepID=UPI003467C2EE
MEQKRMTPMRITGIVFLASFLLISVTACGAIRSAFANLGKGTDETVQLATHLQPPVSLNGAAKKLDDLIAESPTTNMSAEEQRILDAAKRRSALLKELASMIGVSDEITEYISDDAVVLVEGSLRRKVTPEFAAQMRQRESALLKDALCSSFSDMMSPQDEADAASATKNFTEIPNPDRELLDELNRRIEDAGYALGEFNLFVDLKGLSSASMTRVEGYLDALQDTMSAATWESSGAFNAYMRHCVLK